MITNSDREKLAKNFFSMPIEDMYKRFKEAIELVNNVYSNLLIIPEGFYECYGCKTQLIKLYKDVEGHFMMDVGESEFCFSGCEICERKGYVDYILNATKSAKEEDYWPEDHFIPLESSKLPILEISSIMFYLMCNDNDYSDLEINFERPDKNNSKIKNVSEFVEYFIDYKKNREERKEFIKKYFKELKDKLIKNTMVNKYEQNQCLYFECDCLPFDIVHNNSVDEIQLKVCSICYDVGFNSDKISHIFEYYYYATLINPDYSDRDKMFDSLLETVHKYRKYFESLRG